MVKELLSVINNAGRYLQHAELAESARERNFWMGLYEVEAAKLKHVKGALEC
jgi:hypothetical protein